MSARMVAGVSGGRREESGGVSPVSISQSTTPNAHTSVCRPTISPRACSGLMYDGVPITTPISVAIDVCVGLSGGADSMALARPKSRTLILPSGMSLMLAGLRSR